MSLVETSVGNFDSLRFPQHWQRRRAGRLFRRVSEPNLDGLPILSVSIHDGISAKQLEDDERDRKVNLIADQSSYQRVRPGYLAYNMMRAWQGAVGISSVDGAVSPAYVVAKPIGDIHGPYYQHLFKSRFFVEKMRQGSKGIADFRLRLYWEQFKEIELPLPPISEQRAISVFLDREIARIDRLISKNERIADLISAKWEALIDDARYSKDAKWVRFNTVAKRVQRAIGDSHDTSFVPLGLYNRGRGFFKKLETGEEELGDSTFFWVREGDIVFSGQFAWEGAIGFVAGEEDGCVVSHRYPVYRSVETVDGAYLYAFFRTAHGAFLMENCSRGAAGRNRPLSTWSIEREQILVPSGAIQREVAQLVAMETRTRKLVHTYITKATELKSALITGAVAGQIDVYEKLRAFTTEPQRRKFRLIVATEIVDRHRDVRRFGRIKNQKLLFLAEAHVGIHELGGNYIRFAAGPYDDSLIQQVERGMEAASYYKAQPANGGSQGVIYVPLSKAGQHAGDLKALLGHRTDALRKLIDLLLDFDTEAVEAIATLYAVWNDALMDGETPDDAALIGGVLREWHPDKMKFTEDNLAHWLAWMRRNDLVPHGQGPRTTHTMTRDLFA